MQSSLTTTKPPQGKTAPSNPPTFTKRIGSTVYAVSVHFNQSSKETIEDKILRLMESEVRKIA